MADARDLNPFAAPQSASEPPTDAAASHPEAEVLQALEGEFSRMRFGISTLACASLAMAGFTLFQFVYVFIRFGFLSSYLATFLRIAFYCIAGVLAWRIVSQIKRFRRNPKPYEMNEAFAAHAAFWKFLCIVAFIILAIIIPLAFLSVL